MTRFPLVVIDGSAIRAKIDAVKERIAMPAPVQVLYGQKAYLAGGYHYTADELRQIADMLDEITTLME